MKVYILLLYMSILSSSCGISQTKSVDDISREKAVYVTQSPKLKNSLINKSYLLFSINDKWYYLIVKEDNKLNEYFAILSSENKIEYCKNDTIQNPDVFLVNSFNKSFFHKGFINLNSGFYETGYEESSGNPTYFYFKNEKGEMYGEAKLTTMINPNPINAKLYNYLLIKALSITGKNK